MTKRNTKRVDLQKLFNWSHELIIKDEEDNPVLTLHQRVVNDTDFEKARLAAVRKSYSLRKAVRNPETDEYAALMETLERADTENIVDLVVMQRIQKLRVQALDEAKTQMPKPPTGDIELEETETYENDVDEFDAKLQDELVSILAVKIETERTQLLELDETELKEVARKSWENQLCSNLAGEYIVDWLAYLSVYSDSNFTIRYFSSFEKYNTLADAVKKQIIAGYEEITTDQEALKN